MSPGTGLNDDKTLSKGRRLKPKTTPETMGHRLPKPTRVTTLFSGVELDERLVACMADGTRSSRHEDRERRMMNGDMVVIGLGIPDPRVMLAFDQIGGGHGCGRNVSAWRR